MKPFITAIQTEWLKMKKSKVIWLTTAAFTIAPLMAGFFMIVLKDPDMAKNAGFISTKAQIAGEATWPSYLNLYAQIIAVGGIFVFGFVNSWIFGREYADNTIKDLLALPYPRAVIVLAKFVTSFTISFILSAYIVTLGFLIGWMIDLPQWSSLVVMEALYSIIIVTLLTIALSTPVAFFACYSQGYLAPLGFVIITLVFSQIIAAAGFGAYFPWAIPALYSGVTEGSQSLHLSSLLIVLIISVLGIISTMYHWLFADQH
ncbi:MAG TPA: ABC transporter permease [Pseudogracilibacillus sp.]|nr:ABC transporter permease [Pseudogracilibacillus sp.]